MFINNKIKQTYVMSYHVQGDSKVMSTMAKICNSSSISEIPRRKTFLPKREFFQRIFFQRIFISL